MAAIMMVDPNKFVAFYVKQAETARDSHIYPRVQKGGGLGHMLSSQHSVAIPIQGSNKVSNVSKVTPKIQSPAEASVDRARQKLKHNLEPEIHLVGVPPIKKRRKRKAIRHKKDEVKTSKKETRLLHRPPIVVTSDIFGDVY